MEKYGDEYSIMVEVEVGVEPAADVAITKSDDSDPVIAEETLAYISSVTSNRPSNATGETVIDTLPSNVGYTLHTASQDSYNGGISLLESKPPRNKSRGIPSGMFVLRAAAPQASLAGPLPSKLGGILPTLVMTG